MESAQLLCARTLVKVPRVLMKERWKNGAANHDVGKAIGVECAEPLRVAFRTQAIVRGRSCLVHSSDQSNPDEGYGISFSFESQCELQLRRERRRVVIIDD